MSANLPALTNARKTRGRPFEPGNPGGPGRPKGSRHKINEQFLRDFCDAWEAFGRPALMACAWTDPVAFVKVAAGLLPKEFKLETTVADMTDEQLRDRIRELASKLGSASGGIEGVDNPLGGSREANGTKVTH